MSKYSDLKMRLSAVEMLMLMKEQYTYKQLVSLFGLPIPVLSRYVNGHVLPSFDRANDIAHLFSEKYLKPLVEKMVNLEDHVVDDLPLLSNPNLLDKIAKSIAPKFAGLRVDKVLTVEVDGIPVATHLGHVLNVEAVMAKSRKEMGIDSFIEVRRVHSSGVYTYLYVPKYAIKKADRILVVDDIVRTGSTLDSLLKICKEAAGKPVGFFALISVKDVLRKLRSALGIRAYSLLEL